jgi:uncharacterized membrane protein (UPF0127 family)
MKIINKSRKKILYKNAKFATNIGDKLLGLLKKDNPRGLVLKTKFGIHTFGLKNKIDVLVLSSNYIVVKTATISPNKIFVWNPKYNLVIELPNGLINKSGTRVGDQVKLAEV